MKKTITAALAVIIVGGLLTAVGMWLASDENVEDVSSPVVNMQQQQDLAQLVAKINTAMQRHDTTALADNMPKRLYKEMAQQLQTSEEALRKDFQQNVAKLLGQLVDNGYRLNASAITYGRTADGMLYAFVPTRAETRDTISEFMTLAIYDADGWHLIYGGQKTVQNPVFLEIYPAFANMQIPLAKVTSK